MWELDLFANKGTAPPKLFWDLLEDGAQEIRFILITWGIDFMFSLT